MCIMEFLEEFHNEPAYHLLTGPLQSPLFLSVLHIIGPHMLMIRCESDRLNISSLKTDTFAAICLLLVVSVD